jgi:uracil-DNA glycosylase family 4
MSTPQSLESIERDIVRCEKCPRLRHYCQEIARTKRHAYRDQDYWGRPVPGFGNARAQVWIVGLAPGAHGANRTGRIFTGDSSGDWLYRALHAAGFARIPTSTARDDGQKLHDAYISAAGRCAPPDNKPEAAELDRCAEFLVRELAALGCVQVVVPLGKIAFDAVLRLLAMESYAIPKPRPQFAHRGRFELTGATGGSRGPLVILPSYHPSRQNTQTGKLTRAMFDAVFADARALLG